MVEYSILRNNNLNYFGGDKASYFIHIRRGSRGGFGDLSPLNFLEVKIIKMLSYGKNPINVEIFPRDPNGLFFFSKSWLKTLLG